MFDLSHREGYIAFMTPTADQLRTTDTRRLSPAAQEELRRRVVRAVVEDGLTQSEASRLFKVSRQSISTWLKLLKSGEADPLASGQRGRRPGSGTRLTPLQAAEIARLLRDGPPDQLSLPFYLWTSEAVQTLVRREFGLELALSTIGNYLARWGLTVQKPVVRAYERDEEAVRRWLETEYPAIADRAKREGARIWWGDEAGLRSRQVSGRSYGRRGRTPVIRASGKYFGCNMISAITNRGELAFMLYDDKFNAGVFRTFLERLILGSTEKVFLILDNLKVHKAKELRPWLEENKHRIELFFLPSYSPDLNPAEFLNQDVKRNSVGKRRARNKEELVANTVNHLNTRRSQPHMISSFFRERQVRYAA